MTVFGGASAPLSPVPTPANAILVPYQAGRSLHVSAASTFRYARPFRRGNVLPEYQRRFDQLRVTTPASVHLTPKTLQALYAMAIEASQTHQIPIEREGIRILSFPTRYPLIVCTVDDIAGPASLEIIARDVPPQTRTSCPLKCARTYYTEDDKICIPLPPDL